MKLNYQEVLKNVEALPSKEDKLSTLDEYAGVFCEREKYLEAIELYCRALKYERTPNLLGYVHGQIGICYYHLHDDVNAEKYLTKAHKLFDPEKPKFMAEAFTLINFYLGSLYEYQGKSNKALLARKACLPYIESQPRETQLILFSGISRNLQELGRKADAIQFYQRAIGIISGGDPGLIALYQGVAHNHFELGQYTEALQNFQKILELDPNNERREDIFTYIAECYRRLTNYRQALETYLKVLEVREITDGKKGLAHILLEIALCYLQLREFERSIEYCQRALKERIKDRKQLAAIRAFLADNYYEMQRYPEAIAAGQQSLKLAKVFRHSDMLVRNLALSHYKLGDYKNFRKYRDWYRKSSPDDGWNKYLDSLVSP
ncbi:MAG: tetratricopeptide repeat protein [Acidobacteria bacterium]|nr:tetratricopeptide repeat protein [Acidobacteriota bacterium]MBI3654792.1 tetratricopeptide repeat protein [Acidobacteriota bacterium]